MGNDMSAYNISYGHNANNVVTLDGDCMVNTTTGSLLSDGLFKSSLKKEDVMAEKGLRLIQWYIVDPNEHVPGDKAILRQGVAMIKDEREFLINLGIPDMLTEYNKYRITIEYEQVLTEGVTTRKLKEAKIRDLEIIISLIKTF